MANLESVDRLAWLDVVLKEAIGGQLPSTFGELGISGLRQSKRRSDRKNQFQIR